MKPTHQAVCSTCYTCVVGTGSKKDAERAATSHMKVYGHQVSILPILRTAYVPKES